MVSNELMLKVENVSKVYKLGEIGGTTLRDELQRLGAKIRHKPDPTKKVGAKDYNKGEKFKALDNVSFEVKKGERIGIIGHNGAGKSTLLKLISRVTGPTSGNIYMNGRVASMLEVGTGFHPELTGRENVYMNGAILGMTKKEIDAKMEDIIEFSEVRQFIDTPVKRYSSGMYVKLAFSVAAHLDSEILIMDEVLAVGDMAFQKKCIEKMIEVSKEEKRTILYVSHNMSTIRQLCDRVIVLSGGKTVYDGDVENGILQYINYNSSRETIYDLTLFKREKIYITSDVEMLSLQFLNDNNTFEYGSHILFKMTYNVLKTMKNLLFRFTIFKISGDPIFTATSSIDEAIGGQNYTDLFDIDISKLTPARYYIRIVSLQVFSSHIRYNHDYVDNAGYFTIACNDADNDVINSWPNDTCGNLILDVIERKDSEKKSIQ